MIQPKYALGYTLAEVRFAPEKRTCPLFVSLIFYRLKGIIYSTITNIIHPEHI